MLQAIAADATITDLVRQRATELAGPVRRQPYQFNIAIGGQTGVGPSPTDPVSGVNISTEFQFKDLKLLNATPSAGDVLKFSYDVVNVSGNVIQLPKGAKSIGIRNHWIERLGDDRVISVIPKNVARKGRRYAASGSIIHEFGSTIPAGNKFSFFHQHNTKDYPPGKFRFYVEFADNAGKVLQTEQVEFELKPRASNDAAPGP